MDQSSFPSILFLKNRRGRANALGDGKSWRREENEDHLMSQLASPVEIYWVSVSPFEQLPGYEKAYPPHWRQT